MILQNKTANKGRAANVRAATDPSLKPRVAREPSICLLATPDPRRKPCICADDLRPPRRLKRSVAPIERITDAAHFDDERA